MNSNSIDELEPFLSGEKVLDPAALLTVLAAAAYVRGSHGVTKEDLDLALSILNK